MNPQTGHLDEKEAADLARAFAWFRPLGPYPGWHFDKDWTNPQLACQVRKAIWSYYHYHAPESALTLNWYDGLRVQTYWGTDESKQLYVGGCIEPNEFAFLSTFLRKGMVFFDVGANNGLYTLFASRRVGPWGSVWSFEPSAREFDRLLMNLELNECANVWTYPIALSNFDGAAEIKIAEAEHAGHNTLGEFGHATQLLRTEQVPVKSLDRVFAESGLGRLDMIKIDAEGAEFAILEGGRSVLSEMRPMLLLEIFPAALQAQGSRTESVVAFLTSLDYWLYFLDDETGMPAACGDSAPNGNIIAAPAPLRLDPGHQVGPAESKWKAISQTCQ